MLEIFGNIITIIWLGGIVGTIGIVLYYSYKVYKIIIKK